MKPGSAASAFLMRDGVRRGLIFTAVAAWLVVAVFGMALMQRYKLRPGPTGGLATEWPAASALPRGVAAHLIVFAHPKCPCTRASMSELARLMARERGRLETDVVVVLPAGAPPDWREGGIPAAARAIPGVRVSFDADGREAARFGAETSGHALLYDATGRLRFSGGITPARAHEGDNPGLHRIADVVSGAAADSFVSTPVFGCRLSAMAVPAQTASSNPLPPRPTGAT